MFNKKALQALLLVGYASCRSLPWRRRTRRPRAAPGSAPDAERLFREYGRYNGLADKSTYMIGGFNVNEGAGWDTTGLYFRADGDNLILGEQGTLPMPPVPRASGCRVCGSEAFL